MLACLRRYEKYVADKPERLEKSNDPFLDEFQSLVTRVNELTLVSCGGAEGCCKCQMGPHCSLSQAVLSSSCGLPTIYSAGPVSPARQVAPSHLATHCVQKSDEIAAEKNRAQKAAMNAELR